MTSKSFGAKNIDVSSGLNVSGVGTFTTGLYNLWILTG